MENPWLPYTLTPPSHSTTYSSSVEQTKNLLYSMLCCTHGTEQPKETAPTAFSSSLKTSLIKLSFTGKVPSNYTWKYNSQKWPRPKAEEEIESHPVIKSSEILGGVYGIHPNQFECFFWNVLLFEVKVPKSFQDIHIVASNLCRTSSVAQEVSRGSGNPPSNSRLISTHCLTSHLLPYSF